jgi:hypothetical protein
LLRGAIWFAVALVGVLVVSMLTTEAFLGAFESVARQGQQATWSFAGFNVEATMGSDGRTSSIEFGSTWLIVLPLAAFVVGARLWRLFSKVLNPSSTRAA